MGKRKRSKQKHEKDPLERYPTPQWVVDGLARAVEECLPTPDWVVDLGAGDGRIGMAVREKFLSFGTCGVGKGPPHPRLLLVDVEKGWKNENMFLSDGDHFFVSSLEDCGSQLDRILGESRVLYVSNPPFSLANEWVPKAVDKVKKIHAPGSAAVFFLRTAWLASDARADFNERCPPDRIDSAVPRPKFASKASWEYGWFWWRHGEYRGTEIRVMRRPG